MLVVKKNFMTLIPDDNMWLYDGTTISDKVFMPLNGDASKWQEISDAEATIIREQQEKEIEEYNQRITD